MHLHYPARHPQASRLSFRTERGISPWLSVSRFDPALRTVLSAQKSSVTSRGYPVCHSERSASERGISPCTWLHTTLRSLAPAGLCIIQGTQRTDPQPRPHSRETSLFGTQERPERDSSLRSEGQFWGAWVRQRSGLHGFAIGVVWWTTICHRPSNLI